MRLDLVLAELHVFKSRSQARLAIDEGRVLLNARRVKPSHAVQPGDRVTVTSPHGEQHTLEVLALPHGSVSKKAAREFMREIQ